MKRTSLNQTKAEGLFTNPNTFATTLVALCIDDYGIAVFDWDPESIDMELKESYPTIPAVNLDKIHAMIVALTTSQFYQDALVFYHTAMALSDNPVNFDSVIDDLAVEEMAWALMEIGLSDIGNKQSPTPEFSAEVSGLAGAVLKQQGFRAPPPILQFAIMPSQNQVLDQATDQMQMERDERAKSALEEFLGEQAKLLGAELSSAPLANKSPDTAGIASPDYIGLLLKTVQESSRS